jgi:hypothetical protein
MSLLAVEPARCHSQQPANAPTAATALAENPLAVEFQACDANADGALSEAEYLKRVAREMPVLRREFKVFDIDGDGRMNLAESGTGDGGQAWANQFICGDRKRTHVRGFHGLPFKGPTSPPDQFAAPQRAV